MKQIGLALVLLVLTTSVNAQSKIGTIDAEYIVSQMPETSGIQKKMEAYNKELKSELETSIKNYESLVKDYQTNNTTLEEKARQDKENEIVGLENDIKSFRQKASVLMQVKRNELTKPLYQKVDKAMQEVIQEEAYTQIFHAGGKSLAYSRPEDDITNRVMDKMGIVAKAPEKSETNK